MTSRHPRPPIGRRSLLKRISVLIVLLGSAGLLAADTLWWFQAQRFLDDGARHVLTLIDAARWHATAHTGHRGGWPWSARLTLRDPILGNRRGLSWNGDGLVTEISPLRPDMITLGAYGTQTLHVPVVGEPALALRFWGSRLGAEWRRREPRKISFSADALHLALNGLGPDDTIQVAATTGMLGPVPGGFRIHASMHDVAFPALLGRASSRVLPTALVSVVVPDPTGAGADGRIVVEEIAADWGDASAVISGQATLGPDGRPTGTLTLILRNPDAIMLRLRQAGLITDAQQVAVRAVIEVVGAGRGDGVPNEPGSARLDLTLDHGLLSLGQIPLARLPAISDAS